MRTVWRFPLRSGLIILSAVLGVAGATSSIDYALGGREKVREQLARLGTNVLIVSPAQSRNVGGRARTGSIVTTLTEADYSAIRRELPIFAWSSPLATRNLLIKAGDLAKSNTTVIGVEPEYMRIKQWATQSGEVFNASDVRRSARVALLGSKVAHDLFERSPAIGQRLFINRVPFEVVGVLRERGQGLDAANEDDQVYVPLTTAMRRLSNTNYYSGIVFALSEMQDMDRAADSVRTVLRKRHRPIGKLAEDFQVLNQKQLIDTQLAVSAQLIYLVRWVGLCALSVSGFGVLAISWIGVRERTREFGARRALGAARTDIFHQILTEGAVLSVLGAALGVAGGLAASVLLADWANQPRLFDQRSAFFIAAASICLNLIAVIVPARNAASLDVMRALRFE